uniref:claudin-1-like isoform X3 n=1 Tax=Ciona intestinalis TaxID=7719 RepID=UPI0005217703|nr:claudin-1-like isoform X3 [Ciona intestinalis]|eukprot:XP_009859999.1 claudin-1-like isoform X3 [Ciona intestinalis]
MSGSISYLGLVLTLISTIGIIFTTIYREWKRNSVQASQQVLDRLYSCEGLWVRCTSPTPGQFQCDDYDTALLGLPPALQGMRAMMCISVLFIIVAVVCSIVSLPCTAALAEKQKLYASRVAGICAMLAGALCIASVSWYAANIVFEFWSFASINDPFKYEFGSALYVGWIAGGCALISGALMACCNCGNEETDSYPAYTYKPPKASGGGNNTEYV